MVMDDSPRVTLTAISTSEDGKTGCFGRGRCCKNNPGWFGPGEMEQAAAHLGMEPEAFFRKYLVVVSTPVPDAPGRPTVSAFAPAKVDADGNPYTPTGQRVPRVYDFMSGACIFYKDARCGIHPARPIECRRYFCEQPEELNMTRAELGRLWWDAAQRDQ
jgi:Fe-S-cluster containining protein